MPFKVPFDIMDYKKSGLLPPMQDYTRHDEIINYSDYIKGNVDKCVWKKHTPTEKEIASPEFRERESTRILKTGAWVGIKDTVLWLPPNYYFALQYGNVAGIEIQFRLKRLMHVYFKLMARNNAACKGTMTVKNRGDGETTMSMHDCFWECLDGGAMDIGQIGIQSKTRDDAFNPCWMTVQTLWQSLPRWIKDELCSDFASGDSIQEKIQFKRDADEANGVSARNILMKYYPSVYDAMDGRHNMKKCVLDEFLKWLECNFGDSLSCYSKFIMPGFERRGMFDMFSSPPEIDCQSYREGYEVWQQSDPEKIDETTGTTQSRIHRWYSNPLHGIQGAYDRWGDADSDMIYDHIMRERKSKSKDKLLGEVRGYPLTEEEIWGSIEGSNVWSNSEGIKARKIYLIGRRFKNENTKEPCRIYGNLERIDGYIDGDVEFRPTDLDHFDVERARFAFSYLPQNREPLKNIKKPPLYIERMLGFDPSNLRYYAKNKAKQSDAGMVVRQFRDVFSTGVMRCPTMIYCCRPQHQETIFEDVLKAAIYNRALVQYENRSDKFENHAEDRGYSAWLLPTIGAPPSSPRKGDAPSGKGAFLNEGIGLIDAATNLPLRQEDPYNLELYWFVELLDDYLKFDPKDTQKSNLTMADMQCLVGIVKVLHKKIRKPSQLTGAVMEFLIG